MLRIEKSSEQQDTIVRLIGRMRSDDLEELKAQIRQSGQRIVLNLDEVTLVDVDVVRFLRAAEGEGIELRHCPPFIREWISREQAEPAAGSG
jgi:hypothetical protein